MIRILILIIILSSFTSCKKQLNIKNNIKYYPDSTYFKQNNLKEIRLDSLNINFDELSILINKLHRKDSLPFFKLKSDSIIHSIGILINNSGHLKSSSVLSVGKDSVYIDKGYSITKLPILMKRHYENNGANPLYPINASNAFMQIDLKPNSNFKDFKKTIELIISNFYELNLKHHDSLKLKLILKQDIPPPPKNPIQKKN